MERLLHADTDLALIRAEGEPSVKDRIAAQLIERAGELASVEIDGVVALLELVEFFEDSDGYDDVVLFKLCDTTAVMENYVGV
jgi:hypothetical protein